MLYVEYTLSGRNPTDKGSVIPIPAWMGLPLRRNDARYQVIHELVGSIDQD